MSYQFLDGGGWEDHTGRRPLKPGQHGPATRRAIRQQRLAEALVALVLALALWGALWLLGSLP